MTDVWSAFRPLLLGVRAGFSSSRCKCKINFHILIHHARCPLVPLLRHRRLSEGTRPVRTANATLSERAQLKPKQAILAATR